MGMFSGARTFVLEDAGNKWEIQRRVVFAAGRRCWAAVPASTSLLCFSADDKIMTMSSPPHFWDDVRWIRERSTSNSFHVSTILARCMSSADAFCCCCCWKILLFEKLFKTRFRLGIRKYTLITEQWINWLISLCEHCVNCSIVSCF